MSDPASKTTDILGRQWEGGDSCHKCDVNFPCFGDRSQCQRGFALKEEPPSKTTELQTAAIALNLALDDFWMDSVRGLGLTGMAEHYMIRITDAQRQCREALKAEGALQDD